MTSVALSPPEKEKGHGHPPLNTQTSAQTLPVPSLAYDGSSRNNTNDGKPIDVNSAAEDVANPQESVPRGKRILADVGLLLLILTMVSWPWVFFGIVKANNGIQMQGRLADVYDEYPHEVAVVVTLLGTVNRILATFLLGKVVVRFGQEKIAHANDETVTVFGVSALLAFRHVSLVWGIGQWGQLARGPRRFAVLLLLLLCLAGLALIPSGTAGLITPGEFNKTAELSGSELDFLSDNPACLTWLELNRVQNNCDWRRFGNTQFTTCLGENQMLDVLDSGRANMLFQAIGVRNETSSLSQLGAKGGIRFLGSAKGVLPIGPDGAPAFDFDNSSRNPFKDQSTRRGMVSYNYTLLQQGLESSISCIYDTASPIRYNAIETTSTLIIGTSGSCDPAAGLEDVLENTNEYPTLNVNNTLTYWACKQRPQPGALDPTYVIYLRGRMYYEASIGNITCTVSPMRSRIFSVNYLSLPGYFVANPASDPPTESQRATFALYIEHGLAGLGGLIWEGQNWASNIVAETVFSLAAKYLDLSTFERNPKYLELYEAMLQGVLEYEATYSRLIYSLGSNPPDSCLRNIEGSVTYSVRGWYISDSFTQAGLLLPMTFINLATLSLLIACFAIGKFRVKRANFSDIHHFQADLALLQCLLVDHNVVST
ncbi:hypothetical protein MD484_g6642, partial [Candolleomyces efflorescens]